MLKIALAQVNVTVGDLTGNARRIVDYTVRGRRAGAHVVVFPELAVSGYPPEDLLLKEHFITNNIKTLDALAKKVRGITAVVGFVDSDGRGRIYNAAAIITNGKVMDVYRKQQLPNYGVFDEKRYFTSGAGPVFLSLNGIKVGVNICEDIWVEGPGYQPHALAKSKVLINISASPYEAGKWQARHDLLSRRAKETKAHIVYTNLVGGQDELVFDGGSMVFGPDGALIAQAKQFEEDLLIVDLGQVHQHTKKRLDATEEIYQALVLGTRDYVLKNNFKKVALGLSGGIDSALVACIAVDALGKDNVVGISMPSQYNSKATRADAVVLAKNLGIAFYQIPIQKIIGAYALTLKKFFKGLPASSAEENIQARIRGNVLMALSNKFGWLILTTGNKSEMAVGYCTLYGDMSGGYAVIKDVFKTKVYELARWRNRLQQVIPKSILLRAPSAELRPDQTDEASLGSYKPLDQILTAYVQDHESMQQMTKRGLELKVIQKTISLVDHNEYKRRQAPPGIKISARAFGKDWRLPITNKYKE